MSYSVSYSVIKKKAVDLVVDLNFLEARYAPARAKGYEKSKWVQFCEVMIEKGFKVTLYEAKHTFSKYVTVYDGQRKFRVRFSNHRPIAERESRGDCDFFVGVTNFSVTRTEDAIKAVLAWHAEEFE